MKPVFIDTCTVYDVAPPTEFQLTVGLVDTPVALSSGETSWGGGGGAVTVLNLRVTEKPLVLVAFSALTRQKYSVPADSPVKA